MKLTMGDLGTMESLTPSLHAGSIALEVSLSQVLELYVFVFTISFYFNAGIMKVQLLLFPYLSDPSYRKKGLLYYAVSCKF